MKRKSIGLLVLLVGMSVLATISCASGNSVERVDANTVIDLDGYWNDTDVRLVANDLTEEFLASPRVAMFAAEKKRLPLIMIGKFKNASDEHIDTAILTNSFRNAIINSGRADFSATGEFRNEIRSERMDQQTWSSQETAKALAEEDASDFMLQGSIRTIVQKSGNTSVRTYFVQAELVDMERNRTIWSGENSEIKKVVKRANAKF